MSARIHHKVRAGGTFTHTLPMRGVRVALRANATVETGSRRWGIQCENCGLWVRRELHKVIRSSHHYCSQSCRSEANRVDWNCSVCGKAARVVKSRAHYKSCSGKCRVFQRQLATSGVWSARRKSNATSAPASELDAAGMPVAEAVGIKALCRRHGRSYDAMKLRIDRGLAPDACARARGTSIARSKLTEHQVLEIFSRFSGGEKRARLADEFGVTFRTIALICNRETWGWLTTRLDRQEVLQ